MISTAIADLPWFLRLQFRGVEETQLWVLLMTIAVVVASVGFWRRAVAWSRGRRVATLLAAIVPVAHVLVWQPVLSAGLLSSVLPIAQCLAILGAWVWIAVWVWWGPHRMAQSAQEKLPMTDSARRVLLAYGLIPFVAGGWTITLVLMFKWFRFPTGEVKALVCNNTLWVIIFTFAWLAIWRSAVAWTRRSMLLTGVMVLGFLLLAVGAPMLPESPDFVYTARFMLPLMAWGGWMLVTMLVWRFRSLKPANFVENRVCCRACGYSLRGLYATRCPECGDQPTLDELYSVAAGTGDA